MSSIKSEMELSLQGNIFGDLANLAIQSVQLQWGWLILIAGAILLLVSANLNTKNSKKK